MATVTPGFVNAMRTLFPGAPIDTSDATYIRVEAVCPEANETLTLVLQAVANACNMQWDGYDEDGYPCFFAPAIERTVCGNPVATVNMPLLKALSDAFPQLAIAQSEDGAAITVAFNIPTNTLAQYNLCENLCMALPAC